MKLSGIDEGNSVIVLQQKKLVVIILIKDVLMKWLNRVMKCPVGATKHLGGGYEDGSRQDGTGLVVERFLKYRNCELQIDSYLKKTFVTFSYVPWHSGSGQTK